MGPRRPRIIATAGPRPSRLGSPHSSRDRRETMPRALRLSGAALIAALPLLLVACGSSANNGYVDSVNNVTYQLQSDVTQITNEAKVNSPKQAADVFDQVAVKIDAAAAELQGIDPPDQVAGLHAKLVSEMKQLGAEAKGASD